MQTRIQDSSPFSSYARECGEAVNALSNVVQFRAYGKEFGLASSFGLTDGNETFLFRWSVGRGVYRDLHGYTLGYRQAYPYPYPGETHTHEQGMGICCGF